MNLTKSLTPKDTEEIKPGLFIQTKYGELLDDDGHTVIGKAPMYYKQISPAAWDGKIIWKNLLFGQGFLKSFIFFLIILFIAWSYFHDIKVYQDFYEEVISDPVLFCTNVSLVHINGNEITNPLQSDYGKDSQIILEE
ncbi:hypothetical protein LCGC14_2663930 [marine sediment metagenome]|uniref:Uncharacterized protein n=1 Tax=marine sediment metagenome TaxID=412755 RepID=A0A0F8ZR19_9ZZZZ